MDNKIYDDSNDRQYFTIVPNYILNHSNAIQQSLYLQIKRIAGDNKLCYVSNEYFCKKMNISEPTLRKSIKYLIDHKWINYEGKRKIKTIGGYQYVNCYSINDIWKINVDFYTKGGKNNTHLEDKNDSVLNHKGGKNNTHPLSKGGKNKPTNNIYNNINNIYIAAKPQQIKTSFKKDDYKMVLDKYIEIKGVTLKKDEYLIPLREIKLMFKNGRTPEEICNAMLEARRKEWPDDWTLSAIRRRIGELLAGLSKKRAYCILLDGTPIETKDDFERMAKEKNIIFNREEKKWQKV